MIGKRLELLREELRLSKNEFSNLLNISRNTIRRWESGESEPNKSMLNHIINTFSINPQWLYDGVEPMFHTMPLDESPHPSDRWNCPILNSQVLKTPEYGWLQGTEHTAYLRIPYQNMNQSTALIMADDSMPQSVPKDSFVIFTNDYNEVQATHFSLVVVRINESFTVRRYVGEPGSALLVAENPASEHRTIQEIDLGQDDAPFQMIAKVHTILHLRKV